jgi:Response regulator containing CheY-like receiver, AAA-type ATPase, and DNA-binding domains
MEKAILVADDNPSFAELLRATLEEEGYEVVTASTGLAAVACMEKHDIGLAVLDVLMPGISGDAVAERLLQVDPGLPVLLMTGSAEYAAASGLPVLRKPFPQEELVAAVRRLAG